MGDLAGVMSSLALPRATPPTFRPSCCLDNSPCSRKHHHKAQTLNVLRESQTSETEVLGKDWLNEYAVRRAVQMPIEFAIH